MHDSVSATRERFEKWAATKRDGFNFQFYPLGKLENGEYRATDTQDVWDAWRAATADMDEMRRLLCRAVVELEYVHCAEDMCQVTSAEGKAIVNEGMKLLGLKDLSEESLARYGKS